jgi:hypothetical protein
MGFWHTIPQLAQVWDPAQQFVLGFYVARTGLVFHLQGHSVYSIARGAGCVGAACCG